MARYTVERALWDNQDNCIGADIVLETDDYDAAYQAAENDHSKDPNGQTVVRDNESGAVLIDLAN